MIVSYRGISMHKPIRHRLVHGADAGLDRQVFRGAFAPRRRPYRLAAIRPATYTLADGEGTGAGKYGYPRSGCHHLSRTGDRACRYRGTF